MRCALAIASAILGGCGSEGPGVARTFELEQIAPKQGEVFLNHPLVFSFSEPVAPLSITRESLRIRGKDGEPARGVFRIEGRRVLFLPDPVRSPRLDDGGFLPGTRYTVEVAGFPLPDGIRSVDGLPLRCSYTWTFDTVPASGSPRDMFRDRTLGYSEPLRLSGGRVAGAELELQLEVGEPIVIECGEPLFPPSIRSETFVLRRIGRALAPPVELEPSLVENHDAGDAYSRGLARLELRPKSGLEEGEYLLTFATGAPPVDLGGNFPRFWPRPIEVQVRSRTGEHTERFLDVEGRSPLAVGGADGTASWSGSGVVTIRLPRAAGDGRDGVIELGGAVERKDVQATRLELPEGTECALAAQGLVVLRALGRLRISGKLTRRAVPAPAVSWEPGEQLSAWLERATAEDPAWTVLIAGGDLVIDGQIETSGPLVLVAGGWIRVTGEVRQEERQLWLLGEGGGMLLDPTRTSMDLELDPPLLNPIPPGTELRYAVLSVPVPARGRVQRWLAGSFQGRDHAGRASVRYLAVGDAAPVGEPVDDPRRLDAGGQLRLLIELTVGAPRPDALDRTWRPPVVDEVRLQWEWDLQQVSR